MPDRGEKRAFVRANLKLSDREIADLAPRSLGLTVRKIQGHRRAIERQIANGGMKRKPPNADKNARYAHARKEGERTRRANMKRKRKAQRPTAPESNGHAVHPKEALLRRTIFEVGYDAARLVWDEFERAHSGMRSRDGDET